VAIDRVLTLKAKDDQGKGPRKGARKGSRKGPRRGSRTGPRTGPRTGSRKGSRKGPRKGSRKGPQTAHGRDHTVTDDVTAPTITVTVSPAPNAAGWNHTDVTVTFTCEDAESGIASCPPPVTVTTEGTWQVVSGQATNGVGLTATASRRMRRFCCTCERARSHLGAAVGWTACDSIAGWAAPGLLGVFDGPESEDAPRVDPWGDGPEPGAVAQKSLEALPLRGQHRCAAHLLDRAELLHGHVNPRPSGRTAPAAPPRPADPPPSRCLS
jgi:hypothetical protein